MRRLLVLAGLALLALPAASPVAAQDYPRAELFGGYSYARLNPGGLAGNEFNLNGWNAAVQGNITTWLGVVADVSGHYGSRAGANVSSHQGLFGPRITARGPISVFGHALFGFARGNAGLFGSTDSETAFGMALGGGADINLGSDRVAWRVIQGDYLMTRFFDGTRNNARIATGVVIRW